MLKANVPLLDLKLLGFAFRENQIKLPRGWKFGRFCVESVPVIKDSVIYDKQGTQRGILKMQETSYLELFPCFDIRQIKQDPFKDMWEVVHLESGGTALCGCKDSSRHKLERRLEKTFPDYRNPLAYWQDCPTMVKLKLMA